MTEGASATKERWRTLIDDVATVETTLRALAAGELSGNHRSVQQASALLRDVRQALYRHETNSTARPVEQQKGIEERVRFGARLLDSVRDSFVATDLDGDVIYWGQGAQALYGYGVDEVMGRSVSFIIAPGEMDLQEQHVRWVTEMGSWRGRSVRKRNDGSQFWVDTSISLATDETGHPNGLIINDRDISEQVRAEEAFSEREAFYRTFFDESPIALEQEDWSDAKAEIDRLREQGVTDFRGYFQEHREVAVDIVRRAELVDVNQMALRLRGLKSKSDVLGRVVDSPEASLESLVANLVDFAEGARLLEFDWTVRIATGEDRHIIISISIPSDYEDTWKQVLVWMLDITERERVEQALRESEARYRQTFEDSPSALEREDWSQAKAEIDRLREEGVTDFQSYFERHRAVAADIVHGITLLDSNRAALHLRGMQSKSKVIGRVVDSPGYSLEHLTANLVAFAEGSTAFEMERYGHTAAGERTHLAVGARIPADCQDTWNTVLVTMRDVTKLRVAEEALRQSNVRLQSLFDHAPIALWEVDWSAGKAYIDELRDAGVTDLHRYFADHEKRAKLADLPRAIDAGASSIDLYQAASKEDLLSRLDEIVAGEGCDGLVETLIALAEGKTNSAHEITHRTLTGETLHLYSRWCLLPGQEDTWARLMVCMADISERVHAETELQRYREQLEGRVGERTAELARANEQLQQEIVERKHVEESLRQSEVRSRGLLDAMPDLMFRVAGDGTYLDFKSAPGHVLVHPPDEFLGKRILELEPLVEAERTMSHIQQALQTGETQLFEYEQVLGDITRYYEARIAVSGADEVVVIARDITERKRTEEALRESERLLRSVLDANPNAVFVVDGDGRYLLANRAFAEMHGRTPEEIVGTTVRDAVELGELERKEAEQFMAEDAAIIDSGELRSVPEQAVRQPDGSVKWYQVIKVPLTMRGESKYVLCVLTDITKRMWAEERVIRSAKLASMGVLAGGIAHEMRNPLGVILACCQLMLESPDDADLRQQALEKTQSAVRRASRVIKDLLRFARPAPAQMADVDVNVVVDETLDLLADHLTRHRVTVGRKSDSGMPEIKGSSQLLQQVFANLALNSCTSMPDGGLLTVITRADEAGGVCVDFRDTGVGIPPEHLEHIFEPFFTTMPTGSGLGLSVSYSIIQQHDGDIRVESIVGEGSTFTVCLPTDADGSQSVSGDSATEG